MSAKTRHSPAQWVRLLSAVALACGWNSACAYELETHAQIAIRAFERSGVLDETARPTLLERYGLTDLHNLREAHRANDANIFGAAYYDFVGNVITTRLADSPGFSPSGYEEAVFRAVDQYANFLTIGGWVARGAIREDDYPSSDIPADDRCTDNTTPCYRVVNHFFDPYHNRALTLTPPASLIPRKAPDWALGAANAFDPAVYPDATRTNHFSMFDAREAMFRALTLKRSAGNGSYDDIFSDPSGGDYTVKASAQLAYWATTFRAVGDVVHLVQDMAQPQHTRDDIHVGDAFGLLGRKSFYEAYIDARSMNKRTFSFLGNKFTNISGLDLTANGYPEYPVPRFNFYSDYWSTSPGTGSLTGFGLADYSSRGFYTVGTNIGSGADFPQPPQDVALTTLADVYGLNDIANEPIAGGKVQFYMGTVKDTAAPALTEQNVALSSYGVFDDFLKSQGQVPGYSINRYNMDEMARLLMPRAVAYSTGLIDYFFRGKLKVDLPNEGVYAVADYSKGVGFSKVGVVIQNVTEPITPPVPDGQTPVAIPQSTAATTPGVLFGVLRYRINTCMKGASLDGAPEENVNFDESCRTPSMRDPAGPSLPMITVSDAWTVPSNGIDAPTPVIFTFPNPLPFNATDVELQVVYRGPLGAETDGIAVGFEQMSEPTFFDFNNCMDPNQCLDPVGGCLASSTVNLPYQDGGPVQASVTGLPMGRYARVGFLTRAGYRDAVSDNNGNITSYYYATNNQDFGSDQVFTDDHNGAVTWTWPAGVMQTGRFIRGRQVAGGANMLTWRATMKDGVCRDSACFNNATNSACYPITNTVPVAADIWFLPDP